MKNFNFNFTETTVYNIIIVVYLLVGVLYIISEGGVPHNYSVIIIFCILKAIFNYKKCTISYLECRIRNVKRQDGLLASLLDYIVDLRNHDISFLLYFIGAVMVLHTRIDLDLLKERMVNNNSI